MGRRAPLRTGLAALVVVAVAALPGAGLPRAVAAPTVIIKARTELRLKPVRRDDDGAYLVAGELVDRFTGAGLPGQRVTARMGGQALTVVTSADGSFVAKVDSPGSIQDVAVEFTGSSSLDAAKVRLEQVDIDKAALELTVAAAPTKSGVQVSVEARSDGTPVNVKVELLAGPADADDLPPVGALTTGGPPTTLRRADLGGPGRKRLRARFAGDSLHAAATADTTFELNAATTTTFAIASPEVAYEDDVRGTGRVADDDGTGVSRVAIAVLAGDRRVAQTVTGTDGTFKVRFEAEVLGQGRFALEAVVENADLLVRPSRSPPVVVTVAAPQPVPIAYTIAAFIATTLCAAGFFLARARPWQRLARKEPPAARSEETGEPIGGVVLARPSLVSTLRRPHDHDVVGAVKDSVRGRPLAGVNVEIALGDDVRSMVTGDDGAFAFEALPPGEWRAAASAPGHVAERFTLMVPHRGELRGLRVDLVPVRERVFQLYRRAGLPILPDPALWGIWSPRQIVDHVRSRRPSPALAALTDFVEDAYFSARMLEEGILAGTDQMVEAAIREQALADRHAGQRPGV